MARKRSASEYLRTQAEPVSSAEMDELFKQYAQTKDAALFDRLVELNLGLAYHQAAQVNARFPNIPFEDLAQEASLGLMRAVEGFDPTRGNRFSTYAVPWINAYLQAYLRRVSSIAMPRSNAELVVRVSAAEQRLSQSLKRTPTDEEIAKEVGMDPADVRDIRSMRMSVISLDSPADAADADARPKIESVTDDSQDPEESSYLQIDLQIVRRALDSLDDKARRVVEMYYGIEPCTRQYTFKEIGDELGFSKQRAHQILKEALERIKNQLAVVEDR